MQRLYISSDLDPHNTIVLSQDQAHYLIHVMRLQLGDEVLVFNGRDGEWITKIEGISKKSATLSLARQSRPQINLTPLALIFAPIKHDRLHFMVEKATELGVTDFYPIITSRCQIPKINHDKIYKTIIEAAEQSERLCIPTLHNMQKLTGFLTLPPKIKIFACAERTHGQTLGLLDFVVAEHPKGHHPDGYGVIIGPEGGFTPLEIKLLESKTSLCSLGAQILRTETAAIKALSLLS
jgi:16S rRNA (uracil1498-N3)-methyltransferase